MKVQPASPPKFRAMKPAPHPRLAEIAKAQPPMKTQSGHGSYTRSLGGGLGR